MHIQSRNRLHLFECIVQLFELQRQPTKTESPLCKASYVNCEQQPIIGGIELSIHEQPLEDAGRVCTAGRENITKSNATRARA